MTEVTIKPLRVWDELERTALRSLTTAVYPETESADWPGRFIEWAPAEWGVTVTDERGELLCYAGLLIRQGVHDGSQVRIGGVGGVKTHPRHRGAGYASAAMRAARQFFQEEGAVDFGLLVCEDMLIPYYERLGWQVFDGDLLTEQPEGKVRFTFNRVMLIPAKVAAPRGGVIDLNGPPW